MSDLTVLKSGAAGFNGRLKKKLSALLFVLLLLNSKPQLSAAELGIATVLGFVDDSSGLVDVYDNTAPNFFSSLDSNNIGTFGWNYTNTGPTAQTNVLFFGFLDADIDRALNTALNEYGGVVSQILPPGAPVDAIGWNSFQIDEPGFTTGSIFNNLLAGFLDNTNHVPAGTKNDVSLALGIPIGTLEPGRSFTATFTISKDNIGGLSQTDPDSNYTFYFNGYATNPATTISDTPEPTPMAMLLVSLACIFFAKRNRPRKGKTALLTLILLAISFSSISSAVTIIYPDFSSTTGLVLNGDAAVASTNTGLVLRLVSASSFRSGSAFSSAQINASSFSTYFQLRFTQAGFLGGGADGLVFVVQPVSSSIGASGGGEGYQSVSPSVGVEFDIFQNPWDTNNSHVAVLKNGDVATHLVQYNTPTPMLDGNVRYVWIDYDGSTLQMRISTTNIRPAAANLSYNINIPAIIGQSNAYVGFTAATGAGIANHEILTWQYNSTFSPIGVAQPLISDLSARFKSASVDLTWSPPALPSGATLRSYSLYRRTDSTSLTLVKAGITATNYTDTGLANGMTYYYVLHWLDGNNIESPDSTEISATPTSLASQVAHNVPPTILSNPIILATVGGSYSYPVLAANPNPGDVLTYSLPVAPTGMLINPATGLISWTPISGQAGTATAKVRVQNQKGLFASQAFTITIQAATPTSPPVFTSSPSLSATVGQFYSYQAAASDPNPGAVLTYSLSTAPAGMTIGSNSGFVQWVATAAQLGQQNVTVKVQDQFGLSAVQSFTINTAAAPVVNPTITSTPVVISTATQLYSYQVTAIDPNASQTLTFSLPTAPSGMAINSSTGLIQWTPTPAQQGSQNVTVRVQDAPLNLSSNQMFIVQVAAAPAPASVTITSPPANATITQLTKIIGTISDPNAANGSPLNWTVSLLKPGAATYQTIATGTTPVTNDVIATFDPTLLPNDVYTLRVAVTKGSLTQTADFRYSVAGNLKLGNFSVQFTDLSIPVAGIPITITRRYDSLDTTPGDFGAGWRLALPGQVRNSSGGQAYSVLTRVYVTRPDGKRVGFTFAPVYSGLFLPVWNPLFKPDPGVTDTLTVPGDALFYSGGGFYNLNGAYSPTLFTLTTKEGIQYQIDENAGLQKVTDRNGNTLTVTPGGLISSTGVSVAFQRDAQGRIVKITEPGDTPGTLLYGYDSSGNLLTFTDQNGNATQYQYQATDFPNYLTGIVDPLERPLIRNVYDTGGRVVAQCDANGNLATLAGCAKFSPDATANLQTIINARGFRTDLLLDANGNVLTERHWLDGVNYLDTVRTYDANNNQITMVDPAGNKTVDTYDVLGNKISETDPLGHTTRYTYNSCNQALTITDPAGNITSNAYDTACNLLTVTSALNAVTIYNYNAQGQQTDLKDAIGNHWAWVYDSNGFLKSIDDPFGKATTFSFSPSGDLLARIDRNARRIDFQYDASHRLTKETWNTPVPRVTTYLYDSADQLINVTNSDSVLAISYTKTGLVETIDNEGTPNVNRVALTYVYDGNNNILSVHDTLGGITNYSWDAVDRISHITQTGNEVNPKRVDYFYDSAGFLTQMHRFSDTAGTQQVANTLFATDCNGCAGRVTEIRHRNASTNSVIADLAFVRDSLGNVISSTDSEGAHIYTYDLTQQLLSANHGSVGVQPNEHYSYDLVGNRLSSHVSARYIYSYSRMGAGNRLLEDTRFKYQYDDEGNLVRRTEQSSNAFTTYTYDYRNLLVSSEDYTASGILVASHIYTYDGLNRRIASTESGIRSTFIYDGLNPIIKRDSSGAVLDRRLYGRTLDDALSDDAIGQTRWLLPDQIGSIRDIVDSSASILGHVIYDSFGQTISGGFPLPQEDLGFNSREFEPTTSLGYFRARFLDPSSGRFLSEDVLSPYDYKYAANNPLVLTDPLGLDATEYGALVNFSLKVVGCDVALYQSTVLYDFQKAAPQLVSAILDQQRKISMLAKNILFPPNSILGLEKALLNYLKPSTHTIDPAKTLESGCFKNVLPSPRGLKGK